MSSFRSRASNFGYQNVDVALERRVPVPGNEEFRDSDFGVSRFGFRVPGFRFRVSGSGYQNVNVVREWLVSGSELRVSGFRFPVSGFWFQDSGMGYQNVDVARERRVTGSVRHVPSRELPEGHDFRPKISEGFDLKCST